MQQMLSVLGFVLATGAQAVLWTVLGGLAGTVAVVVAWLLVRRLFHGARERRPFATFVSFFLSVVIAVPLGGAGGAFLGAARVMTDAVREERLLHQAAELAFDGAARALRQAQERTADASADEEGQIELALRLVEGKEQFAIDSMDQLLGGFSDAALGRALRAYESGRERVLPNEKGGAPRWVASVLGARFIEWLIDVPSRAGSRWTVPVAEDLAGRAGHEDGLATGREIGEAVARVHIVGTVAQWTYWSVALNGWICLGTALLCIVAFPLFALLFARLFGPLKDTHQDAEGSAP